MKATLKMFLPLIAAVLLATSCSKDDNNESDVVVNNGPTTEVSNEQGTTDDIVTFPFSVRVSTGNSLSKIAFSGKDGTSEYTVQFDDEVDLGKKLTVTAVPEVGKDYSDVTGELVLRKDEEGKYWFDGSISASTNATALKDGTIQLTGTFDGGEVFSGYKISHKSLGDLMNDADVKHKFLAKEFNFKATEIMILDQVAYFCIEVADTQEKFDLTIDGNPETFISTTNKKFWIAVSVGTVVKGNLISTSGITAKAGKIYKANRTNDVDLGPGFSVLWRTKNLGADKPGDFGLLYAYGETEGKEAAQGTYFSSDTPSYTEAENPLASEHDAATVALGAGYRMPTGDENSEFEALKKCESIWEEQDGHKGNKFKTEYGSIFLPAAGLANRFGYSMGNQGCYYWTCTPLSTDDTKAYRYHITEYDPLDWRVLTRGCGQSVRPVRYMK